MSRPRPRTRWPPTSAWRRSRCTRSPPSTTCTTSSRWARSSSTSAPTCRASCATAQTALDHVCKRLGVEPYGTTADGLFTVQPSECLGACADAPVMLVNDRQMLSFMSAGAPGRAARHAEEGREHDRPVEVPGHGPRDLLPRPPHRRADLRRPGRQQLAPEGLRGARRLPGAAQDPRPGRRRRHDARPGDRRGQGLGPARPRRRGLSRPA